MPSMTTSNPMPIPFQDYAAMSFVVTHRTVDFIGDPQLVLVDDIGVPYL